MKNKRPHIETVDVALRYILKHATDKRKRVMLTDQCEWLETKLAEIARLARTAKRLRKLEAAR